MTVASVLIGADIFVFIHNLAGSEFAFINPDFNADSTIGGVSCGYTVVNVGTESLKGNGTFTVAFAAGDFSAAQTTGNGYLDTFSACAHGSAYSLFNSTAEADTSFQLGSNVFTNQDSAHVGGFDFENVDIHFLVSYSSQGFLDILNARAAAADNHARFSGINGKLYTIAYTFNANLGNACYEQVLL